MEHRYFICVLEIGFEHRGIKVVVPRKLYHLLVSNAKAGSKVSFADDIPGLYRSPHAPLGYHHDIGAGEGTERREMHSRAG